MELKDVKFETVGEAAKAYAESTLVIRKQFFDGVVARFQDTIKTRTEMLVEEQSIRIGIGQELQKEYHKNFEIQEQIRKQKYWRCLARAKNAEYCAIHFKQLYCNTDCEELKSSYNIIIELHLKWKNLWIETALRFSKPIEPIEKDLVTP